MVIKPVFETPFTFIKTGFLAPNYADSFLWSSQLLSCCFHACRYLLVAAFAVGLLEAKIYLSGLYMNSSPSSLPAYRTNSMASLVLVGILASLLIFSVLAGLCVVVVLN